MSLLRLDRLSRNQKLALLAVALGLGALVLGGPRPGKIVLDERELAAIVEGEVDHVTPDELADWIVAGRQDYLKAKEFPAVYILLGGLKQWTEQVVFPEAPGESAGPVERIAFAKAAERAKFFGGASRAAAVAGPSTASAAPGGTGASAPTLPKVVPPPAPAPGGAAAKKKKEGC